MARRGARRLNRGRINSELRQQIAESVRDGHFCLRSLGAAASFPDPPTLSRQLHSAGFPTSPRTLERWRRVARCVGHTGNLLEGHDDDN